MFNACISANFISMCMWPKNDMHCGRRMLVENKKVQLNVGLYVAGGIKRKLPQWLLMAAEKISCLTI